MSFSLTVSVTPDMDPATPLTARWCDDGGPLAHQAEIGTAGEANDLFNAAVDQVREVCRALGDQWTAVSVAVSGHANPGHTRREGWAHEYLQITVSVLGYAG